MTPRSWFCRPGAFPVVLLALWMGTSPEPSEAQASTLFTIERRIEEGRIAEAREALELWWMRARGSATRSDLERALWLRGRLTVDPRLAELEYQRLVLEYPGSRFADQARLRLAGSAEARGDLAAAADRYRELEREAADLDLKALARAWLASRAGRPGRVAETEAAPPIPQASSPDPPDAPAQFDAGGGGDLAVQFGAFRTNARARRLARPLIEAGIPVRVVRIREDALWRVRAGRYGGQTRAEAAARSARALGFEAIVVSNAGSEVGG